MSNCTNYQNQFLIANTYKDDHKFMLKNYYANTLRFLEIYSDMIDKIKTDNPKLLKLLEGMLLLSMINTNCHFQSKNFSIIKEDNDCYTRSKVYTGIMKALELYKLEGYITTDSNHIKLSESITDKSYIKDILDLSDNELNDFKDDLKLVAINSSIYLIRCIDRLLDFRLLPWYKKLFKFNVFFKIYDDINYEITKLLKESYASVYLINYFNKELENE